MSLPWAEPFAAALALRHEPGLVLLESMPGFGALGRRSYLAARPAEVATDGMRAVERLGDGWWAGWLSYDLGREIERAARRGPSTTSACRRWRSAATRPGSNGTTSAAPSSVRGDGDASHLLRALARPAPRRAGARAAERWESSLPRPGTSRRCAARSTTSAPATSSR